MADQEETERTLSLTRASEIRSVRPKWMWKDRIPLGTITIFAGRGGEGKSSFALYLSACINEGILEGDLAGQKSPVLIISHEDDWGTVMVPRLKATSANTDLIYRMSVATQIDETTLETVPAFPMDGDRLREAIEQTGARLVIIDPIPSTMGGDLHKVADVRRALDPLAAIAQEYGVAIIGVMHFNKGSGNASDKLSGSHAFRDAVRSLMLFATDDETGQRVVSIDKSNYSTSRGESFAFNLVSEVVETDDGERTEVGRVQYIGDTDLSVETIINRVQGESDSQGERSDMERHIYEYLFEAGGSAEAKDVIRSGLAQGFREADLKKTRSRMTDPKVSTQRVGFGKGAKYLWAMDSVMDSMDTKAQNSGTHGAHEDSMMPNEGADAPSVTPSAAQLRPVQGVGTTGPEWTQQQGMAS